MALSEDFVKAVESKDITMVRIMLSDSMLVDLTLKDFDERLKFAEKNLSDLYDSHDGEILANDVSNWNKALLDEQMVKVVGNFSKERVEFLKKLVRHIYSTSAEKEDRAAFVKDKKTTMTQKQVGTGVAACGAVVAVVGLATSTPAIVITGAVVAVAGGVVIATSKR